MPETSVGTPITFEMTDDRVDDIDLVSIAESEIPVVREQARAWLITNNTTDQKAFVVFAAVLVTFAVVYQAWWSAVLAACLLMVIPFRWMARPHFQRGDLRRGVLWANLGTFYFMFPMVLIVPSSLPIAMQNVIGPVILAATYLDRRFVRRMVPGTIVVAVAVAAIGLTTDGVGLEEMGPRWLTVTIIVAFVGANLWLVLGDVQELNLVHLRSLQRATLDNRELQRADRALRDSRRRLAVAADQERVRLEHDLHDGAQQQLVSLSMRLRLAADLAEEGQAPTGEALLAMHVAANEAIEELRNLAQGVYPARLHELGLSRALRAVARRSAIRIDISDTTTGDLDDTTRVALYFVCLEAIQNATKHGDHDVTVEISLAVDDEGGLVVTIADDGPGFDPAEHAGSRGLLNMADRVGALGGRLSIDAEPGAGTTVVARLPAGATAAGDVMGVAP